MTKGTRRSLWRSGRGFALAGILSDGGEALSFQWTVNAAKTVVYARDGHVVAMFDPADLDTMNPATGREWLAGVFSALERWPENGRASVLALAEELSGVRLDREWRNERHLGIPLGGAAPPAPRDPEPFLLEAGEQAYVDRDPRLTAIINDPSPDRHNDIIHMSIDIALRYVTPESDLEREALQVIADEVRNERSEQIRTELPALIEQAVERQRELEKSWPDPSVDFPAYLEYARAPDVVREMKALGFLHLLVQALNPDRPTAAYRTPEKLGFLQVDIDDNIIKNLLTRLAYWITHGVNP